MLEHVLIGDAGPALVLSRFAGHCSLRRAGAAIRFTGCHRSFGLLNRPTVAVGVWAVALASWHIPAVYERRFAIPGSTCSSMRRSSARAS